ncbi:unnamed protein product [Amoebophrya sp. A120]|nr:unnamed protein product [Amoebophrya sp. A120]|eukprot:GSA120T00013375001.1
MPASQAYSPRLESLELSMRNSVQTLHEVIEQQQKEILLLKTKQEQLSKRLDFSEKTNAKHQSEIIQQQEADNKILNQLNVVVQQKKPDIEDVNKSMDALVQLFDEKLLEQSKSFVKSDYFDDKLLDFQVQFDERALLLCDEEKLRKMVLNDDNIVEKLLKPDGSDPISKHLHALAYQNSQIDLNVSKLTSWRENMEMRISQISETEEVHYEQLLKKYYGLQEDFSDFVQEQKNKPTAQSLLGALISAPSPNSPTTSGAGESSFPTGSGAKDASSPGGGSSGIVSRTGVQHNFFGGLASNTNNASIMAHNHNSSVKAKDIERIVNSEIDVLRADVEARYDVLHAKIQLISDQIWKDQENADYHFKSPALSVNANAARNNGGGFKAITTPILDKAPDQEDNGGGVLVPSAASSALSESCEQLKLNTSSSGVGQGRNISADDGSGVGGAGGGASASSSSSSNKVALKPSTPSLVSPQVCDYNSAGKEEDHQHAIVLAGNNPNRTDEGDHHQRNDFDDFLHNNSTTLQGSVVLLEGRDAAKLKIHHKGNKQAGDSNSMQILPANLKKSDLVTKDQFLALTALVESKVSLADLHSKVCGIVNSKLKNLNLAGQQPPGAAGGSSGAEAAAARGNKNSSSLVKRNNLTSNKNRAGVHGEQANLEGPAGLLSSSPPRPAGDEVIALSTTATELAVDIQPEQLISRPGLLGLLQPEDSSSFRSPLQSLALSTAASPDQDPLRGDDHENEGRRNYQHINASKVFSEYLSRFISMESFAGPQQDSANFSTRIPDLYDLKTPMSTSVLAPGQNRSTATGNDTTGCGLSEKSQVEQIWQALPSVIQKHLDVGNYVPGNQIQAYVDARLNGPVTAFMPPSGKSAGTTASTSTPKKLSELVDDERRIKNACESLLQKNTGALFAKLQQDLQSELALLFLKETEETSKKMLLKADLSDVMQLQDEVERKVAEKISELASRDGRLVDSTPQQQMQINSRVCRYVWRGTDADKLCDPVFEDDLDASVLSDAASTGDDRPTPRASLNKELTGGGGAKSSSCFTMVERTESAASQPDVQKISTGDGGEVVARKDPTNSCRPSCKRKNLIPWEVELLNTDPALFQQGRPDTGDVAALQQESRSGSTGVDLQVQVQQRTSDQQTEILLTEGGLYLISTAMFGGHSPKLRIFLNGRVQLEKYLENMEPQEATGISIVEYFVVLANSRISVSFTCEMKEDDCYPPEGFLEIQKL